MTWLSNLSFQQAARWALVWPALIVTAAALFAAYLFWIGWAGDGAIGIVVVPAAGVSPWVALPLALSIVLFGPSLLFLAIWRFAQR
jgi:hypothetical protein